MLRNLRHRARTITLRTEFWIENGTQKWFEIQAWEVRVASKIDSGGLQGDQGAKKLSLKALGTPRGLAWEAIWEAKIVPNPSRKHFQDAIEFEAPFRELLGRLGGGFWKLFWSRRLMGWCAYAGRMAKWEPSKTPLLKIHEDSRGEASLLRLYRRSNHRAFIDLLGT